MKVTEEKLKEWNLLLEERKQRGLKIEEFCKEKNITVPQFYYYHKRIAKMKAEQERGKKVIKPIQIINPAVKENSNIRFILPNSLQCIVPRDMSIEEIKKILGLVLSC